MMDLQALAVHIAEALRTALGMEVTLESQYAGDDSIWGELTPTYPADADTFGSRRVDFTLTIRTSDAMPTSVAKALFYEVVKLLQSVNKIEIRNKVPVTDFYIAGYDVTQDPPALVVTIQVSLNEPS